MFHHGGPISRAEFSPDDLAILTAGEDGCCQIWDATTGQPKAAVRQHQGAVRIACFSPDGQRLLTGSEDGTARVWDTVP